MEEVRDVRLEAGKSVDLSRKLRPDSVPGNLIRNPRFSLRWLQPDQPDWWTRDTHKQGRWASALIRVPLDQKCAVRVEFHRGKQVPVSVRWRGNPSSTGDSRETLINSKRDREGIMLVEVVPDAAVTPFEKGFLFLEVLVHTDLPVAQACRHVAVNLAKATRDF